MCQIGILPRAPGAMSGLVHPDVWSLLGWRQRRGYRRLVHARGSAVHDAAVVAELVALASVAQRCCCLGETLEGVAVAAAVGVIMRDVHSGLCHVLS